MMAILDWATITKFYRLNGLVQVHLLLKVPCTARSSKQSILKEIHLDYSLEGVMM